MDAEVVTGTGVMKNAASTASRPPPDTFNGDTLDAAETVVSGAGADAVADDAVRPDDAVRVVVADGGGIRRTGSATGSSSPLTIVADRACRRRALLGSRYDARAQRGKNANVTRHRRRVVVSFQVMDSTGVVLCAVTRKAQRAPTHTARSACMPFRSTLGPIHVPMRARSARSADQRALSD